MGKRKSACDVLNCLNGWDVVNNYRQYGRWAFAEFRDVYQMETDFKAKVEAKFNAMIDGVIDSRSNLND